ncbi:DUF6247 family protein [Nocardiopsis halophila]|uniref:DUF6247 family protein n=1 Tax=Nocardiopsis halophila TaxID=141692 RepID=UPI0004755437|nr:DUF6247 family protein [Nocardiopsis halophila]
MSGESAASVNEPLIPQPAATPEALREAVAVLDSERLGEFLSDLARAKAESRKTSSMRPMLAFYNKWSQFAALHRYPARRERLRQLEAIVGSEPDPVKNRAAIRGIAELLAEARAETDD